jgi:hypothetical protein
MIITNINGGIGNQLFQYAIGRALAIKNKDILQLDIQDLSHNQKYGQVPRELDLTKFNIIAPIAETKVAKKLRDPYGLPSFVLRRLRMKFISYGETGYNPQLLKQTGDVYLDGYFQSYKYFADIRQTLLTEITLKEGLGNSANDWHKQIIATPATVSIHIRRGDYVTNENTRKNFGPCPLDYYTRTMEKIETIITNPTYVIFSDDITWVKENLPLPKNTHYVSGVGMTAVEDLVLMSTCTHNIIANSSFSWWGAWLNKNPKKIVIAPTPWLDNGLIKEDNLLPPEWIRISKYNKAT